ncbi:MAG TPA: hypothetical protein VMV79_00365 [Alphaproteobacteria bacterium]|nr:hypothetical protein [Alphaproteobacteria bacterium]
MTTIIYLIGAILLLAVLNLPGADALKAPDATFADTAQAVPLRSERPASDLLTDDTRMSQKSPQEDA